MVEGGWWREGGWWMIMICKCPICKGMAQDRSVVNDDGL